MYVHMCVHIHDLQCACSTCSIISELFPVYFTTCSIMNVLVLVLVLYYIIDASVIHTSYMYIMYMRSGALSDILDLSMLMLML